jgi:predicted amidohydrolase
MLKVALLQSNLYWENITANLAMFEEKISQISTAVDLIILPEMFSTGFTMNAPSLAEPMNLTTCKWLVQQARKMQAVMVGSCIIKEKDKFYNRLLWVEPNGNIDFYDKKHLFRMAGEHQVYTAGNKKIIKKIKEWNICPLICYDLRFPVWSRNVHLAYDLLLYIANWPNPRLNAWDILLQARAVENLSFCIGVNRVGTDGKGKQYNGNSAVYDFKGQCLLKISDGREATEIISLDKTPLDEFRAKFPIHLDADEFSLSAPANDTSQVS